MPNLKLQSSDGKVYEVDVKIAKCFGTIKTMLEDLDLDDDDDEILPLPNVRSPILEKAIEWATHYKDAPQPDKDELAYILPWDEKFLDVDQSTLFEIILAANYLDIKKLLHVACQTVAKLIEGKSTEQLRETFNIENDFSEAEREEIRRDSEMCRSN